jgi:hypothetical protein
MERTAAPDIDWKIPAFAGVGIPVGPNAPHSQSPISMALPPVVKDEVHENSTECMQASLFSPLGPSNAGLIGFRNLQELVTISAKAPQLAMRAIPPADENTPLTIKQTPLQSADANPPTAMYGQTLMHGWELPILNSSPTCLTDDTLLSSIQTQRQLAAAGGTGIHLVGPKSPGVSPLLSPGQCIRSHPVSGVLTDIIGGHSGLSYFPEKVAILYSMHLLLRVSRIPSSTVPSLFRRRLTKST